MTEFTSASQATRQHVAFTDLIDLAAERSGGAALFANDDFFAPKENLLKSEPAVFIPGEYTEYGKWMDGWETRRKRVAGHDFCIIRLGLPGVIHGINVDTAHFLGNFPEYCSVDALQAPVDAKVETFNAPSAQWKEILPKTRLLGGTENLFSVSAEMGEPNGAAWTHLRLNIYPDGGVARLRVHGEVKPDWKKIRAQSAGSLVDLAAAAHGGTVVTCNDMFFGQKDNLILPGRALTMGEGWETRRKRGPGHDWLILKLAATGKVSKIEIDTNHFKGNYPESCSIEGCRMPARNLMPCDFRDRTDIEWRELLPRTKLEAHNQHFFDKELHKVAATQSFDYLRLNIFPDGGISRFRVYGEPTEGASP